MTTFDVSFNSPSGTLQCQTCDATGHLHTVPDVLLKQECPVHHKPWVYCGGCVKIWCPGNPGRNDSHAGEVVPVAADLLPAE